MLNTTAVKIKRLQRVVTSHHILSKKQVWKLLNFFSFVRSNDSSKVILVITRYCVSQIREQMSGPEISQYEKSILGCGLWSGLDCEIKGSTGDDYEQLLRAVLCVLSVVCNILYTVYSTNLKGNA